MQWQTKLPLIAILRGITPDEALAHVGAVIDAGFDAVEIPLNSPQWEKSIPAIVDAYGDKALIGAGTVLKPEQVDALARMGCQLIVTPNIHSEVIRRAVGYGMTPENLAQWIDAGCAGAGLGSDLYRAGQSVERTAQQAAAFVKAYREAVQ
ncbi:2-dehydro-3-deoxy-6-phosphogalactonate aldolase [Escherichia coli]|nr:2-dehydro-3-deoxy-6-phosphogalactonate aldolase [Escherichia coli]